MESIYIRNFGGIEELAIELDRINIFIGKQASGKSITVKLLYYFKGIVREIWAVAQTESKKQDLIKKLTLKFEEYFPTETWPQKGFDITYSNGNNIVYITKYKSSVSITFSPSYIKLFSYAKKLVKNHQSSLFEDNFNNMKLSNDLSGQYFEYLKNSFQSTAYNTTFIPAGRSFYANLQSSIFSFLSNNKAIDPFLVEFGSMYETIKQILKFSVELKGNKAVYALADKIIFEILGSTYQREKEKDFLIHSDKRKINVSFSSSGQQETLPLLLILKAYTFDRLSRQGVSLIIEEPEAHLFPAAQKKVVELLGLMFNNTKNESQVFITTHSPYVLTSLNNLVQGGIIEDSLPAKLKEKVYKILPKEILLNYQYLKAYAFNDGKVESIIDTDTGLIYASYLDSISNEISNEFDELLNIEV